MNYYNEILEILEHNFERTSEDDDAFIQYAYEYDDGKALYITKGSGFGPDASYWEIMMIDSNLLHTNHWMLKSKKIDSDQEMYEFLTR